MIQFRRHGSFQSVFQCFMCVFSMCSFGEMLAFTLTAFLELMDHGIVSWDLISLSFIKQASTTQTLTLSKETFLNIKINTS